MCLSKSNVDALDVVLNLLYKGVKEIKDLFETITNKVSDWVSQKLLSKLGFLTIEQQNSLPLVLTQRAPCAKGTKDWSIKVKFSGKYKFQVNNAGGGGALKWSFGLGAGVVFGCKNETYRTYPFVDVSHPVAFMFTFKIGKTHKTDFTAEGSLSLGLKVYSMKFSSIDSGIKGGLSLSLKAGAKNLPKPWPCPTKVKCSLKKKFSLLKLPSGELIDFTDTDDILDMLVYTQEVEVAAKWEDVTSWFSKKPDPIPDGIPDPQAGSELIMGALRHIATSNISLPSKLELNSSDTPKPPKPPIPEAEFAVGVDASWSICVGPNWLCSWGLPPSLSLGRSKHCGTLCWCNELQVSVGNIGISFSLISLIFGNQMQTSLRAPTLQVQIQSEHSGDGAHEADKSFTPFLKCVTMLATPPLKVKNHVDF